jgi:hypothetical protein
MTKIYEVDRHADTLLIITGSANHKEEPAKSAKVNGHVNGVNGTVNGAVNGHVNGDSHELLQLKVSSKHLVLASQHFKNKFGSHGESYHPVQSDGRMHFRIDGADPTAVTAVMNIVHSRGSRVPKTVDVDLLTKIVSFVEEYKFTEAVEAYTERWVAALHKPTSTKTKFGKHVIQWIYLSQVFQLPVVFQDLTRLAIAQSTGPLNELAPDISITKSVVGEYSLRLVSDHFQY